MYLVFRLSFWFPKYYCHHGRATKFLFSLEPLSNHLQRGMCVFTFNLVSNNISSFGFKDKKHLINIHLKSYKCTSHHICMYVHDVIWSAERRVQNWPNWLQNTSTPSDYRCLVNNYNIYSSALNMALPKADIGRSKYSITGTYGTWIHKLCLVFDSSIVTTRQPLHPCLCGQIYSAYVYQNLI